MLVRHFSKQFDFKYFITRGTILSVYRESLKLAYSFPVDQRSDMIEMMKIEFDPFRGGKKLS